MKQEFKIISDLIKKIPSSADKFLIFRLSLLIEDIFSLCRANELSNLILLFSQKL